MAVPAAGTLIRMEDSRHSDLTIKVTGYQWKWHYDYMDQRQLLLDARTRIQRARQLGSGIDPNGVANYLVDVDNPLWCRPIARSAHPHLQRRHPCLVGAGAGG